ncbi:autophagy-related protein [Gorgonomyces haynaldii]|nr:autophagy-related protein [Gorgonomyces haynaldii]
MPHNILLKIEIEKFYYKDVMRAIIHSILFQRTLVTCRPQEIDVPSLETTYPRIVELESVVEEKISQFANVDSRSHLVKISFFDKKPRKSWFGKTEDAWEEWVIQIQLSQAQSQAEQIQAQKKLSKQLQLLLFEIAKRSNDERDYIPALVNNDPFPFEIAIASSDQWTFF